MPPRKKAKEKQMRTKEVAEAAERKCGCLQRMEWPGRWQQ